MTDTTPAQREAEGVDTIDVDWDGITITFPASPEDADMDAVEAFENGKAITFARHLLGTERYDEVRAEWRKANGRKPTPNDMAPVMEAVAKAWGFETQGNSQGS
jgi:hypothetical protein